MSFWAIFCSFTPLMTPKTKISKKWRKIPGDITTLYMRTINKIIWCMVPKIWSVTEITFLSFWIIFCSFTPLTTWKIKIFKKWKNYLEISSFYKSVPDMMVICYTVPETWCMTDVVLIFQFRLFFALLTPNNLKN